MQVVKIIMAFQITPVTRKITPLNRMFSFLKSLFQQKKKKTIRIIIPYLVISQFSEGKNYEDTGLKKERRSDLAEGVSEGSAGDPCSDDDDISLGSSLGPDLSVGGAPDAIISDLIKATTLHSSLSPFILLRRRFAPQNVHNSEPQEKRQEGARDVVVHHYRHILRTVAFSLHPRPENAVAAASRFCLSGSGRSGSGGGC